MMSGSEASERLAIIARLRKGSRERAKEILAEGPPYELAEAGFRRHSIFLEGDAVVFVFEGRDVQALVSKLIDDPAASGSFSVWAPLLAGTPTLSELLALRPAHRPSLTAAPTAV